MKIILLLLLFIFVGRILFKIIFVVEIRSADLLNEAK